MELVACVKLVYDETQISVDGGLNLEGVPVKISEIDKNAVEEAVRIKEELGGRLTLVTVVTGPFDEAVLKEALAMGADRALIVRGDVEGHNPVRTALAIKKAIEEDGLKPDLILCGEGSSDYYSCSMAPLLGELMGLPSASFVSRLELKDGKVLVERALEGGIEILELPLPAVISVTFEINEPRIPTVLKIMRAGKKERKEVEFSGDYPRVKPLDMSPLVKERRREKIEGSPEEVAKRLAQIIREVLK